ncbi:MAG: hypothetical protein HZB68_00605 [Candidatus Aenigmarchaeota archaeon]|nr:hypothetical protein [Candidatus Aenigmarchaeota archaeon]
MNTRLLELAKEHSDQSVDFKSHVDENRYVARIFFGDSIGKGSCLEVDVPSELLEKDAMEYREILNYAAVCKTPKKQKPKQKRLAAILKRDHQTRTEKSDKNDDSMASLFADKGKRKVATIYVWDDWEYYP